MYSLKVEGRIVEPEQSKGSKAINILTWSPITVYNYALTKQKKPTKQDVVFLGAK